MKKKLYILLLFQTLVISAFGINVTTTAPNTGVSKVMTVDNGKVYELNFKIDLLSTSLVEVNIKDQGLTIASQQISASGSKALAFTTTSNAITIEFNRMDMGTAFLQFEVDNIQLKEVVNSKLTHEVGTKNYELSDHLGNVRSVVSDKKDNGSSKVISANDYYPFGMEARSVSDGEYRFWFNGMEKDDEMTEGIYDFGARIYNSRLGRWLAVDPMRTSNYSDAPYKSFLNNPLRFIDNTGEIEVDPQLKKDFPKAALFLENIDKLYENKIDQLPQELKTALEGVDMKQIITTTFQSAFKEHSTLDEKQIGTLLTNGKGALVSSYDLDWDDKEGVHHLRNGHTHPDGQIPGSPTTNADPDPDNKDIDGWVVLDDDLMRALEFTLGGEPDNFGRESMDDNESTLAVKAAVATLFHELVHYGRFKTGAGNSAENGGKEHGHEFEEKAFGKDIGRYMTDKSKLQTGTFIEEE